MHIHPLSDFVIRSDYESPIKMTYSNVLHEINQSVENAVLKAVLNLGIDIVKGSLIKALKADEERYADAYERGFHAGYNKCYEDTCLTNDEWS